MTSGERKRSSMRNDRGEWPSRASEPRSRDSGQGADVTSGKGRRDEVGPTGIYPASSLDEAPDDVEVMTPGEIGRTHDHDERGDDK